MKLGCAIIMQLRNPSQPKMYYASVWPVIYQEFFDVLRLDHFLHQEIDF
jgi:hypothetical protein